ncbi:hypothetical protein [Actinobacillus delphinicola]|uniref:Uncharacterized protein n=1 Tax=Actinobacillus delphinicola TaxID=51161 RepID=A0A448TU93_9PAST|nr:hypothetical protein [Actinobacillus delphinicola]VEJ09378.1 Uncharacterised protein [Actinobacillus delphinicola]
MLDKINTELFQMFKQQASRDTAMKISDDLRKSGAIAGVGLIGLFVQDNKFSIIGGSILIVIGLLSWGVGIAFAHFGAVITEQMEDKQ